MRFAIFIIAVLFPVLANADGTIYLSDIDALLKQQPELYKTLKTTLDIEEIGLAPRISAYMSAGLGGRRVAPYTFDAKPKGSKGPYIFVLEIRAKTRYYDRKGKEVPVRDAVSMKEELESIGIKEKNPAEVKAEQDALQNQKSN